MGAAQSSVPTLSPRTVHSTLSVLQGLLEGKGLWGQLYQSELDVSEGPRVRVRSRVLIRAEPEAGRSSCNLVGPRTGVGSGDDCDVGDAFLLDRLLHGGTVDIRFDNACDAYFGF